MDFNLIIIHSNILNLYKQVDTAVFNNKNEEKCRKKYAEKFYCILDILNNYVFDKLFKLRLIKYEELDSRIANIIKPHIINIFKNVLGVDLLSDLYDSVVDYLDNLSDEDFMLTDLLDLFLTDVIEYKIEGINQFNPKKHKRELKDNVDNAPNKLRRLEFGFNRDWCQF